MCNGVGYRRLVSTPAPRPARRSRGGRSALPGRASSTHREGRNSPTKRTRPKATKKANLAVRSGEGAIHCDHRPSQRPSAENPAACPVFFAGHVLSGEAPGGVSRGPRAPSQDGRPSCFQKGIVLGHFLRTPCWAVFTLLLSLESYNLSFQATDNPRSVFRS